jgi:adenosylhomocysteine nucleosidase
VRQIGIITGLAVEAQALRRAARLESLEDRVFVAPSGGDQDRIKDLAREFTEHGADTLLSMGLAGALSDDLKTSGCVVPTKIVFEGGSEYPTDALLNELIAQGLEPETAAIGDLLCVESEVAGAAEKRRLFEATGAIAVDMESGHLAMAAREAGLAFAALRIILDEAEDSLPPSVLGLLRRDGTTDQGKLMKNLFRRPADLPPLVGLMVDSLEALNCLSRVARPVLRQLV